MLNLKILDILSF